MLIASVCALSPLPPKAKVAEVARSLHAWQTGGLEPCPGLHPPPHTRSPQTSWPQGWNCEPHLELGLVGQGRFGFFLNLIDLGSPPTRQRFARFVQIQRFRSMKAICVKRNGKKMTVPKNGKRESPPKVGKVLKKIFPLCPQGQAHFYFLKPYRPWAPTNSTRICAIWGFSRCQVNGGHL